MQLARKNVTSDPFAIYRIYEILAKEVKCREFKESFYNCDKSGFPLVPSKCKYVAPVCKKCNQITHEANRENQTVLAVCSVDGKAMDPLIVFKGNNLQSTYYVEVQGNLHLGS